MDFWSAKPCPEDSSNSYKFFPRPQIMGDELCSSPVNEGRQVVILVVVLEKLEPACFETLADVGDMGRMLKMQ